MAILLGCKQDRRFRRCLKFGTWTLLTRPISQIQYNMRGIDGTELYTYPRKASVLLEPIETCKPSSFVLGRVRKVWDLVEY